MNNAYFTADNTEGFSSADLALLNDAMRNLFVSGRFDADDLDEVKHASALVNDNWQVGGCNTVASLTRSKNHPNRSKLYRYSAHTAQQNGATFEHQGALSTAIRKAKARAHESFPAWQYAGHGPTITVRHDGEIVHQERL